MSCNLGAVFGQEMEAAPPSLIAIAEKCSEFLRENLVASNDDDVPCLAEFNLVSTKTHRNENCFQTRH